MVDKKDFQNEVNILTSQIQIKELEAKTIVHETTEVLLNMKLFKKKIAFKIFIIKFSVV